VAQWLRHYATSRKVPGSVIGGVTGDFFHGIRQLHVPGVDLASKDEYQHTPGGKDSRCVWLTTYHLQVPMSWNLGALTSQNPLGPIRLEWDYFFFTSLADFITVTMRHSTKRASNQLLCKRYEQEHVYDCRTCCFIYQYCKTHSSIYD
jgi:hypothetical protein